MPAAAIRHIHNTPHLNFNLQLQDNDFGITSESVWNSYTRSVFTLPIIIGVIGIICVITFQFFWCCKACMQSVVRTEGTTRNEVYVWMKKKIESRKRVTLTFYLLIALVVASMSTYYSAVIDVDDGFNTYYDALDYLDNSFSTLSDEGENLQQQGVDVSYNLGNSTCPQASDLSESLYVYQDAVEQYTSYVDPVSGPVSNAHDQGHYFNTWKQVILWSIAGIIYLSVAMFFFAHYCRGKVMMHVAIGVGEVVLIFLILSNMVWFSVLILGADFCMAPTENAIQVAPADTQEVISYYATCQGTNPIAEPLAAVYNYTLVFNATINALTAPDSVCPGDPYLLACHSDVNSIIQSLTVIAEEAKCDPIKEQWDDVVNEATCDSMFYGILDLWAGQYWTASTLFCLVISASIVYSHFDSWFLDEDTSPFNTGNAPSSANRQREKSINLGSSRGQAATQSSASDQVTGNVAGNGADISYSTTFLYDDSPRKDEEEGETLKFVF